MCGGAIISDFIPETEYRRVTPDFVWPNKKTQTRAPGDHLYKPLRFNDDFEADFQQFEEDYDEEEEDEEFDFISEESFSVAPKSTGSRNMARATKVEILLMRDEWRMFLVENLSSSKEVEAIKADEVDHVVVHS